MLKEGEKVLYLVIRSVYPPYKIDEFIKKIMEVTPKDPPDPSIDEEVLGATKATEQGHIWMNIFEVKEGQLDAAYARWKYLEHQWYSQLLMPFLKLFLRNSNCVR